MIWRIALWGAAGIVAGLLLLLLLLPASAQDTEVPIEEPFCETWEQGLLNSAPIIAENDDQMAVLHLNAQQTSAFLAAGGKAVPDEGKTIGIIWLRSEPDRMYLFRYDANGCLDGTLIAPAAIVFRQLSITFNGDPPMFERMSYTAA